jgi:CBS domain-containing protein
MNITQRGLKSVTVGEVMSEPVEVISQNASLETAASVLRQKGISGAPVVDEQGRCVGFLSAVDFLRPVEAGKALPGSGASIRTCFYQSPAQRADGSAGMLCGLAAGACPLQVERPTVQGQPAQFCLLPHCVLLDWQQVIEEMPGGEVRKYMTADIVTVGAALPVPVAARKMLDAHIHHVFVVDDNSRPVGILTSTDILAAVAALDTGA